MKIAYIYLNKIDKKTANAIQVLNMLQSLGRVDETVFICGFIAKRKYKQVLSSHGINDPSFKLVRATVSLSDRSFIIERITRLAYSVSALMYLYFNKPDIVYTRDIAFLLFLSYLPKYLKPRQQIFFEPHTIYHISSSQKVTKPQEDRALRTVDYFIPISKGIKNDLLDIFQISEDKITVMSDGVNPEYIGSITGDCEYLRDKYKIGEKDRVVVYTGTFKDWKGVDVLVKSIKYMKNKNTKVILIGGNDLEIDNIKTLIDHEGVENKCIVDGFLPQRDVIKILKSSDVAVIPNKITEIGAKYTSPLKLFEYMACGLPIVCSNLPAMKEVLQNKKNCLYFTPENPKDLAEKVDKLITDKNLRSSMSLNNTSTISDYSWDKRAKSIVKLFQNANR